MLVDSQYAIQVRWWQAISTNAFNIGSKSPKSREQVVKLGNGSEHSLNQLPTDVKQECQ